MAWNEELIEQLDNSTHQNERDPQQLVDTEDQDGGQSWSRHKHVAVFFTRNLQVFHYFKCDTRTKPVFFACLLTSVQLKEHNISGDVKIVCINASCKQ